MMRNNPFHMVHNSPWPFLQSFLIFGLVIGVLSLFHFKSFYMMVFMSFMVFVVMSFFWMRDIIRENNFQGFYSIKAMKNLVYSMILFILSEIMFFFSFFWAFFHFSLAPSVELSLNFPAFSILYFDPMSIPLLNTIILLSSGVTITWSHYSLLSNKIYESLFSLEMSFLLSFLFLFFQYLEYSNSFFSVNSSCYGTVFFITTSFHSLHVLVSSIFLFSNFFRMLGSQFSFDHHLSFEFSIWYWHFVDVVWLFLYIFVYSWCIM